MKKHIKITAYIGTVILCLILTAVVYQVSYNDLYQKYSDKMLSDVRSAKMEFINNYDKNTLYEQSNSNFVEDLAGYGAFLLDNNGGFNEENDKYLEGDIGRILNPYYFRGNVDEKTHSVNGSFVKAVSSAGTDIYEYYNFDDSYLYELLYTGKCQIGECNFNSVRVGNDGYLILPWHSQVLLLEQSFLSNISKPNQEYLLRINAATGVIEDSSDISFLEKNIEELIELDEMLKLPAERVVNKGSSFVCISEEVYGHVICSYVSRAGFNTELIRLILLPIMLGCIFVFVILKYFLTFYSRLSEEYDDDNDVVRIFGRYCVNRRLVSHMVGMIAFAVVLIVVSSIYVKLLINYGKQNINAEANLETIDKLIDLSNKNDELMKKDFLDMQKSLIELIAGYYVRNPEEVTPESISSLMEYLPNVESVTFFDKTGTVELDTGERGAASSIGGTVGYTISKDETSLEYHCWDIINGEKEAVGYSAQENYERYYVAGRRQDKDGIIRIGLDASVLDEFEQLTGLEKVVAQADFGDDLKIYIDNNKATLINIVEPMRQEIIQKVNDLPAQVLVNGYSGVSRIDGVRYYINTRNTEENDYTFMSAKPAKDLLGFSDGKIVLALLILFNIYGIFIVLLSSEKIEAFKGKVIDLRTDLAISRSLEEQMMDKNFRRVVATMLVTTCVMIVVLLGIDAMYADTSLISYLFKNEWSKGLNLFSFTMIMFLFATVIIGGGIIQTAIIFFTKNMGPRGVTIGKLVVSIARLLILVGMIIAVIAELGVNLSMLLTGAGIFGAVITFTAQQTVNDFLTGFFIVFEGLFNVGDWITVNGFRGQVVEIGIRTTKIAVGENVQIINNSELKTVTLMAGNRSGAVCELDIAYKEDIDAVISLLRDNKEAIAKQIPAILEGPFIDGVTNMGDSSVTITIWAIAKQEKVCAVERELRRVAKKLFDENGIEIPFKQVTIHQAGK